MGHWQDFWKPVCALTPMDARRAIPSVMWKVGTSRRTGGSRGLERNCCELRRIGRAARDVSRWLRIRRSITKYRNERTKCWDLRLSSAAYCTVSRCEACPGGRLFGPWVADGTPSTPVSCSARPRRWAAFILCCGSPESYDLLLAQRFHRIDRARAASKNEAGWHCGDDEQERAPARMSGSRELSITHFVASLSKAMLSRRPAASPAATSPGNLFVFADL